MFRYHDDGSKKLNACSSTSQAWFIFNLSTKISSFTDRILHYLHVIKCPINPPLTPCYPVFIYLENQPSCSWWQIPIHSCPWSADNCLTLYQSPTPSIPTHRSSYNVYLDDINNTSRLRLAQ